MIRAAINRIQRLRQHPPVQICPDQPGAQQKQQQNDAIESAQGPSNSLLFSPCLQRMIEIYDNIW